MKPVLAGALLAATLGATLGLGGCVYPQLKLSDDFGRSTSQTIVTQVADPDARYVGKPDPGSSGARVDLAQERYVKGQVLKPASTQTSQVSTGGGGGGNGGGGSPSQ